MILKTDYPLNKYLFSWRLRRIGLHAAGRDHVAAESVAELALAGFADNEFQWHKNFLWTKLRLGFLHFLDS